ncbi:MAG: glycerate kinase [Elusimicrobiaceae bacterium]|nr:glycerate kinase [Elusimicrobiaceae bacterium]
MNILLLPGAFKGSLSALRAGQILSRCLSPRHHVRCFPIADGGDGFMDTFAALDPKATLIKTRAKNAFLQTRNTSFLLLSDGKTAVLETARICGLGSAKKEELDPLGASSYGVGQVLLEAVKHGATKIYVGLGGVACNDGGAGLSVACGAQIFDKQGRPLPLGAQPLLQAANLDLTTLYTNFKGIQIIGCADVTNPLLGPKSSAKIFGPQKGATPEQVKILDKAMARWAHIIRQAGRQDTSHTPSTAAAGAIAAGLYGCFRAKLLLGANFLLQKAALEMHVPWADLIITSEGKLDAQTFYGKAPLAVLRLAQKYKKPVLFICGQADWKSLTDKKLARTTVAELIDFAPSLEMAQKYAGKYITQIGKLL